MKILILGATGMLGSTLVRYFNSTPGLDLVASSRESRGHVSGRLGLFASQVLGGYEFSPNSICALSGMTAFSGLNRSDEVDSGTRDFLRAIVDIKPDVLINAIGMIKQQAESTDLLQAIPLNTLLPHVLSRLCKELGTRFIHVSTDCVFSGVKGNYTEADQPDAVDIYGRSKYMGEVRDQRHVFTIRTSIIGHELWRKSSLLEWFLSQGGPVMGFRNAIFSGLPTVELARVIAQHVLPRPELHGIYHISSDPIDKYMLLQHIAQSYKKDIKLLPMDEPVIDRSLDSSKFRRATGFQPETWPELIRRMHTFA